jgi:hypothetical protein
MYTAVVVKQFKIGAFLVRQGLAQLRGDVAQQYRANLQSAWVNEDQQ